MKTLVELKHEVIYFCSSYLGITLPKQENEDNAPRPYNYNKVNYHVIPCDGMTNNYHKVITLGYMILISDDALKVFTDTLTEYDDGKLNKLRNIVMNIRDVTIKLLPYIPVEMIHCENEPEYDGAVGVNFTLLDERFERVRNLMHTEFQHIVKEMGQAGKEYNKDNNRDKTDELYIRFNTRHPGAETEFFMTLTKIPAIAEVNRPVIPSFSPIDNDDFFRLFEYPCTQKFKASEGITCGDEIIGSLSRINKAVHAFIDNKDTNQFPSCKEYARKIVDGVLIPMVVTLQPEPFSVFGGDKQGDSEPCLALIDKMVGELFAHLDSIPVPEGSDINHYAVDYDSMNIYGRDINQKVLGVVKDEKWMIRTTIEPRLSRSFMEAFKTYLKSMRNRYVFSHKGKIDEATIRTTR